MFTPCSNLLLDEESEAICPGHLVGSGERRFEAGLSDPRARALALTLEMVFRAKVEVKI